MSKKIIATIAGLTILGAFGVAGISQAYEGIPAGFSFTKNLYYGMTDPDVVYLKTILAAEGCVSGLANTQWFGAKTKAGAQCFCNKYKDEISQAAGYTVGCTGYVGTGMRTKLNALLGEVAPTPTPTPTTTPTPTPEAAEGILTAQVNPSPASGVTAYQYDKDVAVLGILLKAKNSDITIQRILFNFGSDKIYSYANYLTLYDGDNAVKGVDLNSTTVYKSGSNYYLSLSGLNVVVPKDGQKVLTVKMNISVDPEVYAGLTAAGKSITITIDQNAVRGVDTAGINQYGPTNSFYRTFTIKKSLASNATLSFARNANTPLSKNVAAGSLGYAYGVEVLKFDIKAEYDSVKITDIKNVSVAMGGEGGATATTAYLYDGSTLIDTANVSAGDADFDDIEVTVAKDTTKTLTIKVDYSSVSTTETTSTVTVTANTTNIVAENSAGTVVSTISGTVTSYPVYLYTVAPTLALTSANITKTPASEVASSSADAKIIFTMTAEGGDVYISTTGAIAAGYATSTAAGACNATSTTYDVTGATLSGSEWVIAKGTTATITVDVKVASNTLTAGYLNTFGYVTLTSVSWKQTSGGSAKSTTWVADIYKTGKVYLP